MLKNVDTKINVMTQIISFSIRSLKKIINPYFYNHLFSALLIMILPVLQTICFTYTWSTSIFINEINII